MDRLARRHVLAAFATRHETMNWSNLQRNHEGLFMSEFKVGDTVKVKKESGSPNAGRIGEVARVVPPKPHGDTHLDVRFDGHGDPQTSINASYVEKMDVNGMYRDAVFAVDPGACNLSGLAYSLARHMDLIWYEARKAGKGSAYVNSHPVTVLFVSQMAYLCGCENTERYCEALAACREKAGLEKEEANV